jgi:hypothetical protein
MFFLEKKTWLLTFPCKEKVGKTLKALTVVCGPLLDQRTHETQGRPLVYIRVTRVTKDGE